MRPDPGRYGQIPIRRIRCPKCRRPPEQLIEHGTQTMRFDVSPDGAMREAEGYCHEGDVERLFARCSCGHGWRVRNAVQVTSVDVGSERPHGGQP
jgi:hypothetical protein